MASIRFTILIIEKSLFNCSSTFLIHAVDYWILYEWAVNINVKTMSSGNYMKRPVAVLFPGNLIHNVNVLYNNMYFCFIAHTFLSAFQQISFSFQ